MISEATYKKSQPLQYNYIQRVMTDLCELNDALVALRQTSSSNSITTIREKAACIADLAMVHGFDGVEIIAQKISTILSQDRGVTPGLLKKLESSIYGLQTVLRIEEFIERRMTVEKVERVVTKGEEKIHSYTRRVFDMPNKSQKDHPESDASQGENDVKVVPSDSESRCVLFDIKEDESVMQLTNNEDRSAEDDTDDRLDRLEFEGQINADSLA